MAVTVYNAPTWETAETALKEADLIESVADISAGEGAGEGTGKRYKFIIIDGDEDADRYLVVRLTYDPSLGVLSIYSTCDVLIIDSNYAVIKTVATTSFGNDSSENTRFMIGLNKLGICNNGAMLSIRPRNIAANNEEGFRFLYIFKNDLGDRVIITTPILNDTNRTYYTILSSFCSNSYIGSYKSIIRLNAMNSLFLKEIIQYQTTNTQDSYGNPYVLIPVICQSFAGENVINPITSKAYYLGSNPGKTIGSTYMGDVIFGEKHYLCSHMLCIED